MAGSDLEQTPAQTLLAAGRTYTPAEPTHSAISQLAPSCYEGREHPASNPKVKVAGGLKLALLNLGDCCINVGRKCRFFGHIRMKTLNFTPALSDRLRSRHRGALS